MKVILLLAVTLLSLAFTVPQTQASSTPKATKRGRTGQKSAGRRTGRKTSREQATKPAPVFDPTPFREGVPEPPKVTVAHRNFPRNSPEWAINAPDPIRLRRVLHAAKVLQARIYAASKAPAGRRAEVLLRGRLAGAENDAHDEGNYGGHRYPPASINDFYWIIEEWESVDGWVPQDAKTAAYADLCSTMSKDAHVSMMLLATAQYPGPDPTVMPEIYANEFILWYGAWLPHLEATAAWLEEANRTPEAPPAPLDILTALLPTFISPFEAPCASSTFPVELLLVVYLRVRWLSISLFLKASSVVIASPEFEGLVQAVYWSLAEAFPRGKESQRPPLEVTWKQLCEAEDAPLRQIFGLLYARQLKSARKV